MARIGIIFGIALCALTVGGLMLSPLKSPYQFIPMILGIPMLFLGVVALNPHRRRQSMHVSASISAMGLIVGGGRMIALLGRWVRSEPINELTFRLVLAMTVLCAAFLATWIIVWLRTRRREPFDTVAGKHPAVTLPKKTDSPPELQSAALGPDRQPERDLANRD